MIICATKTIASILWNMLKHIIQAIWFSTTIPTHCFLQKKSNLYSNLNNFKPHLLGFTLVELLAVMFIIIILSAIAIPAFHSTTQTQLLKIYADELYFNLQNARSEAIKQSTDIYISFVTGNNWCYGINTNSACNCNTPSSCNLGSTTASNNLLTLSINGFTNDQIIFENVHASSNGTGTITFTDSSTSSSIILSVSLLGNIHICSDQIPGYQTC